MTEKQEMSDTEGHSGETASDEVQTDDIVVEEEASTDTSWSAESVLSATRRRAYSYRAQPIRRR